MPQVPVPSAVTISVARFKPPRHRGAGADDGLLLAAGREHVETPGAVEVKSGC
jgi:hypothetical protein